MNAAYIAFTLAEVLIALAVIGVISAITVPVLIKNTQNQEIVTALKKTYSTLSQVTNQITAEEGTPKADEGGWAKNLDAVYEMYRTHLSNVRECGSAPGCFIQGSYKYLHGGIMNWIEGSGYRRLVMADGVQINFDAASANCRSWRADGICAVIWADVNGAKKPNIIGKDVHTFYIMDDGRLLPAGCGDIIGTFEKNNTGHRKTCQVLKTGEINY